MNRLYPPRGALLLLLVVTLLAGCGGASGSAPTAPSSLLGGETVRLLIVGDPFSNALRELAEEFGRRSGGSVQIEVVGYDELRELTLRNAQDLRSSYDIVSFDVLWLGEYGAENVLLPLDALIAAAPELHPEDFLPLAYTGSRYQSRQLGLPIQPHPELLWYRLDQLEAVGLAPPVTTDDLLAAALRLNHPERGEYGLCWNGQRGEPLGQQMAHFYAAFGQPLLDPSGWPSLDTPRAVAAARFAMALLPVSPPDVLSMAWNQRARRFAAGGCAMTYEWAARSYLVEEDPASQVAGLVGYAAAPHAPNAAPVTPLGTWSLGIPANIGERRALAWAFLEWLSRADTQRTIALHGNGGMPRMSLLRDPELAQRYPAFRTVNRPEVASQLADWMRPAVPQWPALAAILGTVYHDMLRGELTPEQAAAEAQARAELLFAAH